METNQLTTPVKTSLPTISVSPQMCIHCAIEKNDELLRKTFDRFVNKVKVPKELLR